MGMVRLIDSLHRLNDSAVRVEILNEPIQVRKMMIEGTADLAILPSTMASVVYNKGMEYQLVAITGWGGMYLFGTDTSIAQWGHLRGKRVHVMARGMTPDVLFRYLLKQHGLDPERDVTLDYSFPTHIDLANAVAAGQAPIGVIAEPLVGQVMQRNKGVQIIFDLNAEWRKVQGIPMAVTALLVKKGVAGKNNEALQKILASYRASIRWVNQNPDSAASLIVRYGILPDYEVARQSIPRSQLDFVNARAVKDQIEAYFKVFYDMNPDIIGGKLPDDGFYY
jgi:NitT/TauT family transport system substrate-binding protein